MYPETPQSFLISKLISNVKENIIWNKFLKLKSREMYLVTVTQMIMVNELTLLCLYKKFIWEINL